MKKASLLLITISLMLSCSSEPVTTHSTLSVKNKALISEVNPDNIFTVKIEGMSCEMGCGGSIRKALKATGGVSRVEFDFLKGRKIQTAKISFEKSKISEKEMINILTTINDKQFNVVKTINNEIVNATKVENDSKPESTSEKQIEISQSESSFIFPNLFDIFRSIVQ